MNVKFTPHQQILAEIVVDLIEKASGLLGQIDDEIQTSGSTGENIINHLEHDLKNNASYVQGLIKDGFEL
jgi:myosin heavy subunit